jgi:hypothetical protein
MAARHGVAQIMSSRRPATKYQRTSIVFLLGFAVAAIRSCLPVTPESCRLEPQYQQRLRVSPVSSHARTKTTVGAAVKCPVK